MSTNNVRRFTAPDANNRITPFVTLYEAHYDAIAAELAALRESQRELVEAMRYISTALNDKLVVHVLGEMREVAERALTRAKEVV